MLTQQRCEGEMLAVKESAADVIQQATKGQKDENISSAGNVGELLRSSTFLMEVAQVEPETAWNKTASKKRGIEAAFLANVA